MLIRYLYILFLGILLSLFIGVGIAAFYPSPKSPSPLYAPVATPPAPNSAESAKMHQDEINYQKQMDTYQTDYKNYNRNVSIISLIGAIIFLIISFTLFLKTAILSDGLLLGGLFTLIYSIFRGFGSEDSMYRFIVVTISLVIAFYLGYRKFILSSPKKKK